MNGDDGELFNAISHVVVRNVWYKLQLGVNRPKDMTAYGGTVVDNYDILARFRAKE